MIERFTKEQFEAALPSHKVTGVPLWSPMGVIDGEHVYTMPVTNTNKRIVIRSSVGRDGVAASTGEDSIRLWVEYSFKGHWRPLKKLDAWTTRVPGWESRMTDKLRELYQLALDDSKKAPRPAPKPTPAQSANPLDFLGNASTEGPTLEEERGTVVIPPTERPTGFGPNPEQLAAIEADVDAAVRVLAGPGTGKTLTNSYRYEFLLRHGFKPDNILAVTFSKEMATALLERIIRISPQVEGTAAEKWVCTIHAACFRILKAEGDRRQVAKNWTVKKAIQSLSEKLWPYADERPGWEEIFAAINGAKMNGLETSGDLEWFVARFGYQHGTRLHEARRQFDETMRREGSLTFADMLLDVETRLARDSAFRARWQAQFQVVIVDEGQDTSAQAMRILTTLAAPQDRFFIVGDTDQLLYRFAMATPEANLFEGFEQRFPNGLLFKLVRNYRSTQQIVQAYNALIRQNYQIGGGPYDDKFLKEVIPHSDVEGEPITWQMFENPEEEARALAEELAQQLEQGRRPGDFFIGARTRAQLGYLEGPLMKAKVPFINITGGSFWTSKHVADLVAYVRLAFDESNSKPFERVYNIGSNWCVHPWGERKGEYATHRWLGRAFLDATRDQNGNPSYQEVWKAANNKSSYRPGVEDLVALLSEIQADMAGAEDAGVVVQSVLDNCYLKWLRHEEGLMGGDVAEDGKIEDLYTVVQIASGFENVEGFLEYVGECEKAAEAAKDKAWDEYVVLSTVHRLKGLERPVVFGVGLSENGEKGLLPHTFSLSEPIQMGVLPMGGKGRVEDERCCFYVLLSRAKDEVHLSGVWTYRKDSMGPSRFVQEIGLGQQAQ